MAAAATPPAQLSTRETDERSMRYVRILQNGADGVPGILATESVNGNILMPYTHQRNAVRMGADDSKPALLFAHDAGTGKTAVSMLLFTALHLKSRGVGHDGKPTRMIVTAPPATLAQWENTAHDWLNLPDKVCER